MMDLRKTLSQLVIVSLLIAFGSACSLKVGSGTFSVDDIDEVADNIPAEVEASVRSFDHGKAGFSDASISFVYNNFDLKPNVEMYELDGTWRYYPRDFKRAIPYVGVGVGYFRLFSQESFSTCPSGYICFPGIGNDFQEDDRRTLASGYNPHALLGSYFPIPKSSGALILEWRHEFSKESKGIDLESDAVMIGFRFSRPSRPARQAKKKKP